MPQSAKPSRLGVQGLGGVLGGLILAVGYSAMTYRQTLKATGSPAEAWSSVIEIGVWAVVSSTVVIASVLVLRRMAGHREERLRQTYPDAIVLRSTSLPQLRKALKGTVDSDGKSILGIGYGYLTLTASARGIAVWAGSVQPVEVCRWAWEDVVEVVPASFALRHRNSNGLEITVCRNGKSAALPFVILSVGVTGLPVSEDVVAEFGSSIAKLRC